MATLPSDLSTANVSQLKDYLRQRNLPWSGSKPILIERLYQHHRESSGRSPPRIASLWHPDETYLTLLVRIDDAQVFQKYMPHLRKKELRQWLGRAIQVGSSKIAIGITRRLNEYSIAIPAAIKALAGHSKPTALRKMLQKWIQDGGLPVLNLGLVESARQNATELFHFFREQGGTALDEAAMAAAKAGHFQMVETIQTFLQTEPQRFQGEIIPELPV